jgi:hypothetical protein
MKPSFIASCFAPVETRAAIAFVIGSGKCAILVIAGARETDRRWRTQYTVYHYKSALVNGALQYRGEKVKSGAPAVTFSTALKQ